MQSHTGSLERVSKFETNVLKQVITKGRDPEHGGSQTSRLYCILIDGGFLWLFSVFPACRCCVRFQVFMVVSIRKMVLWIMIKCVLLSVFIRIIFPEGESRMFIRNVDNHLPGYAVFTIYRNCIPFPIWNVSMCTLYTQMGTGL
jgi:hypothetical protein